MIKFVTYPQVNSHVILQKNNHFYRCCFETRTIEMIEVQFDKVITDQTTHKKYRFKSLKAIHDNNVWLASLTPTSAEKADSKES